MVKNDRFSSKPLDFNLTVAKFSIGACVRARENNSERKRSEVQFGGSCCCNHFSLAREISISQLGDPDS